jgi:hypothetical protein
MPSRWHDKSLPLHVDTSGGAANEATALIGSAHPPSTYGVPSKPSRPHNAHNNPHHHHHHRHHHHPRHHEDDEVVFDDDDHITDDGSIAQLKERIGTSMLEAAAAAAAAAAGGGGAAIGAAAGGSGLTSQLRPLFHVPFLPFLAYGRGYLDEDVWADLIAGVVVSVVAIPQGLAYSLLASLPPETGLYTSLVPPLVYGFLGTSRQLSAGPVALVSMFIPTIAVQVR